MLRPLIQHGVGQLEALFASSKANLKVLKQLEHELQFRQVPRALALLERVQAAIPAASPAPAPATSGGAPLKQPDLWSYPPPVQTTSAQPRPAQRPPDLPPAPVLRSAIVGTPRPAPYMTLDEACKALNVSVTTPWQEVERARRQAVQLSHPERVALFVPERQEQARVEAKRINVAYLVLSAAKVR